MILLPGESTMPKYFRLPGLVDAHVHLREPGATHKEDFTTGTKAALAGGYTTIIDMPNNPVPTISKEALDDKIKLASGRIFCDVGFYFGTTGENTTEFSKIVDSVFGLKVYMNVTTGMLVVGDEVKLDLIFKSWPKKRRIFVHAEGDTLATAIRLAKKHQKRLHVCHVVLKKEILMIRGEKEAGMDITCEVSGHNLFLDREVAKPLGTFGLMKQRLGAPEDRKALWDNLDIVDYIGSDHAPHTREEKLSDTPPFGVPGLETTLPLLLTAVAEKRLTMERLIELTSTRPREILGLPNDDETYTEVDLNKTYELSSDNLLTKCGWTQFDGVRVKGKVVKVVLRGKTVYDGEQIVGKPEGKVIFP